MNLFRFPTTLSIVLVVAGCLIFFGGLIFATKLYLAPQSDWSRLGAY